ncbi:hypothetical protein LGH83_11780 [Lichenihabitans sp. PAMC28606]|uniref:hypothetical protein n=1 Tax=Lichenihabitans sp. PAMC28606 TaxID=2880932 RepID=UPI001D0A8FAE|nr:hypothetical protein [Lichenihabitans sp. PAMC28606]UDL93277.1 hypothetical protein LGH83_11780 [Lichenihabitans sp. PAMC28606]
MTLQNNRPDHVNDPVTPEAAAPTSVIETLKDQAAQAADDAKGSLTAMASDARGKVSDIVDSQKSAGAEHLSRFAKAAQSAAGELDEKNPQVARLVRDAASSIDRFADDLHHRDLRDVLEQVTTFARKQPVAFFAGSVLAGFALARFLKSDAPPASTRTATPPATEV